MNSNSPLAVSIISGFLGSGKTTLLKKILSCAENRDRIAIVENELGELPIDDSILSEASPARIDTVLGRTCCETRGTFVKLLREMCDGEASYDRLIIEATGVAHPGMMANSILSDRVLSQKMRVDGIITVVDSVNFASHLDGDGHAREQVAYADTIIINKCDLSSPEQLERVKNLIAEINPTAKLFFASHADVDTLQLLNLGGFDATKIADSVKKSIGAVCELLNHKQHEISTVAVKASRPYAFLSLKEWLENYIEKNAENLYRAKGVVSLANVDKQVVLQGVQGSFYIDVGEPWGDAPRESKLIFIGKNLNRDEIEQGLQKCLY